MSRSRLGPSFDPQPKTCDLPNSTAHEGSSPGIRAIRKLSLVEGMDCRALINGNPQRARWFLPPDVHHYRRRTVPPGWCEQSRNSTGYPEYEQYAVSPQRIILFTLLPLAPVAVFAFLRSRYRCPNKDPLCRKDRPCIACYRKLFYGPARGFEPPS